MPMQGYLGLLALLLLQAPLLAQPALEDLLRKPVETKAVEGIGLAHSGDPFDTPDFSPEEIARLLKQAGGTHYRPHLPLKEALPEISPEQMRVLKKAAEDAGLMETLIEDLSRNGRWERMDRLVQAFVQEGIQLIVVVGCGYRKEVPLYTTPDGTKQEASPDRIGRGLYLALMRWLAGAAVRRYADRVQVWQIENEINGAWTVAKLSKWRVPEDSWKDLSFARALLQTLADTVHGEGERRGTKLRTVHNFVPDLPWAPWGRWPTLGGLKTLRDGMEALEAKKYLDIIGIDPYPNYYTGWPINAKRVAKNVQEARKVADGRPVWVMETGFARAPKIRGFTENRQGEYFKKTFDAAYEAGASLVLAFGWFWNPLGWYNDKQRPLPWWHPRAVEQYWSPIVVEKDRNGNKNIRFARAWKEFVEAAKRWRVGEPGPAGEGALDFFLRKVFHTRPQGIRDERQVSFGNKASVFVDPREFYPEILRLIGGARRELLVQFMTFEPDEAGLPLARALMERARSGVRVKVLVDDYNLIRLTKHPLELWRYRRMLGDLRGAGAEVIVANPLRAWNLFFRNHRKMVVADAKRAMTGGYNPADHNHSWHDLMVTVEGPAAADMRKVFLGSLGRFERSADAPSSPEVLTANGIPDPKGVMELVTTAPSRANRSIKFSILEAVGKAQKTIRLENPYLTDRDFIESLKKAAKRGVQVEVVVPGRNNWPVASAGFRHHYKGLVEAGVRIYEFQGMTHAKVLVVDSNWVSIGSANFDNLSFKHQDNMNLNIRDAELAREIEERMILADIRRSRAVTSENLARAEGRTLLRWVSRLLDGMT